MDAAQLRLVVWLLSITTRSSSSEKPGLASFTARKMFVPTLNCAPKPAAWKSVGFSRLPRALLVSSLALPRGVKLLTGA